MKSRTEFCGPAFCVLRVADSRMLYWGNDAEDAQRAATAKDCYLAEGSNLGDAQRAAAMEVGKRQTIRAKCRPKSRGRR